MNRVRALQTELPFAASLVAAVAILSCGGRGASSNGGVGGVAGQGDGQSSSGVGGAANGEGGALANGQAGKPGWAGSLGAAGVGQSAGGDDGIAGGAEAEAGSMPRDGGAASTEGGASAAGGAVDPFPEHPLYPPVHFPPENPDFGPKGMLGKILFWDEQVSSDNSVACGSCHRPGSGGGSDPRADASTKWHPGDDGVFGTNDDIHGSQGIKYCAGGDGSAVSYTAAPAPSPFGLKPQVTGRKAPTYLDAMFAAALFWDGRATSQFVDPVSKVVAIESGGALESQSVGPPMNSGEMACANRTFETLLAKLVTVTPLTLAKDVPPDMQAAIAAANFEYESLFSAAFPGSSAPISPTHFAFAIATHERHLRSDQTPWDLYNEYQRDPKTGDGNALTPVQIHGLELFMGKAGCKGCHPPPFFSDFQFHNLHFVAEKDLGRQALPGHASDPPSQVKTATLRNAGLREAQGLFHYGYGPGLSLDAVIAWYNIPPAAISTQDIQRDPALAAIKRLELSNDEIVALLDFLRHGLSDPRVKNQVSPFDRPTLSTE